jgi:signal transduction histidine kinase
MSRATTLVGRMAALQLAAMSVAVGLVVVLSFVGVTRLLGRQRDENLRGVADRTLAALFQYGGSSGDAAAVLHEVEEHRPEGTRVEVIEDNGRVLVAVGDGPALRPSGSGGCDSQGDFRACTVAEGRLAVIAGRSVAADAATIARLFWVVLGASLLVLGVGAALSRLVARRGLAPLAAFSARLASIEPGDGARLGTSAGLRELDDVATRFDELLRRIDEAMARERRFSAQASHELRTPLTVLRGELELSLRDPASSPQATSRALASAEAMVRLVEVLLLFSRAESKFQAKDLELLNVCDLLRDQLARAGRRAPEDVARITATLPEEALVLGDEQLLMHAVLNLVDNAWKHTPKDVAIEVSVQLLPTTVELRVADDGPGISGAHRERIFEPFFRDPTSRARNEGYGLGLPFARSVARAHGGDVWLEPARAVGAAFVMRLPRHGRDPLQK